MIDWWLIDIRFQHLRGNLMFDVISCNIIWLLPPHFTTKTESVVIHIHTNLVENETESIKNNEGRERVCLIWCFKVLASCCEIMMDFVSNFFDKSLKPFQQNKFSLAWCAKTSQSKKATTVLKSDKIIRLVKWKSNVVWV